MIHQLLIAACALTGVGSISAIIIGIKSYVHAIKEEQ
jgi:hypothetical protein